MCNLVASLKRFSGHVLLGGGTRADPVLVVGICKTTFDSGGLKRVYSKKLKMLTGRIIHDVNRNGKDLDLTILDGLNSLDRHARQTGKRQGRQDYSYMRRKKGGVSLGRGMSGFLSWTCCLRNPTLDKRTTMGGWMDLFTFCMVRSVTI